MHKSPLFRLIRSSCVRTLGLATMLLATLVGVATAFPVTAATAAEDLFSDLEFRYIGPVGNRVPAAIGVPGDPSTYYAGAASGGIWKSTDGGVRWQPIFDDQDVSSIGSLAIAPSDPNLVWAGTGETFIRSNVSLGNGIYLSTDAGETWQRKGLEETGRIGRIVVHPRNPDIVYAAALGHSYGPQPDRGLYRTKNGGDSWEQVLFVDEETGAIDVVMDPSNPRILYAATWQFHMRTSGRTSGGPGSGIYRSKDGGNTWTKLGPQTPDEHSDRANGTPKGPWGKVGLTLSAADPKRIYALIETNSNAEFAPVEGWDGPGYQGVLWRSDDRGENWRLVSRDNTLHQRPLYYTRMMAAPDNADEITFMSVQQSFSIDGGKTYEQQNSGWDHHDIWIDPMNPERRITGHDGGVSISLDRGKTWFRPQLPIAQVYHVNVDDQIPYFVYGNRQDGPSFKGPSNTLTGGSIPMSAWHSVGGCEVGFAVPTPGNPDVVWTGCYDGILERYDGESGHSRDVSVKPLGIESWPGIDLDLRFQWSFPIEISPHDPNVIYVGSQYVHRTDSAGVSWSRISPDLSTGDEELILRTGGLTFDDAGPTIAAVVFAIAESHLEKGQIWAGTNDGKLHISRDNGETWTDVSAGLVGAPRLGTISNVEPSRHDPAHTYVTVDGHQESDNGTHVYKTEDYGRTWRSLRSDIEQGPLAYAHSIKEDPEVPGLLYLGLHNRLMVSFDDGRSWQRLGEGTLPPAPVSWVEVQDHFGDLVLSTYGRGFFILDDLSPLRFVAGRRANSSADAIALVPPRDAYRFRNVEAHMSVPDVPADGRNPEYGASLHYWIDGPSEDAVDSDSKWKSIEIEIVNSEGEVVRTLDELDTAPGLHRVHWNLRGDSTTRPKRVLPPQDAPASKPGMDSGPFSILQAPGTYTARLRAKPHSEADGTSEAEEAADRDGGPDNPADFVQEQQFEVLKDPHSKATIEDIRQQQELLTVLYDRTEEASTLLNDIESLRSQVKEWTGKVGDEMEQRTEESDGTTPAKESYDALQQSLQSVETELASIANELVDLRLTAARQDTLRWKRKLLARLNYVSSRIQKTDHAPTEPQHEVASELGTELDTLVARFESVQEDLQMVNGEIAGLGLDRIAVE